MTTTAVPAHCGQQYEQIRRAGRVLIADVREPARLGPLVHAGLISYDLNSAGNIEAVKLGGRTSKASATPLTRGPLVRDVKRNEKILFDEIQTAGGRLAAADVRRVTGPLVAANGLVRRGLIRREVIVTARPAPRSFAVDDEMGTEAPPAAPEAFVIEPAYVNAVVLA